MNFEPQKFFIGLMDFFSVLLPGAVVTYLAKHELWPLLPGKIFPEKMSEGEGWAVFLFSSYLLGHFIFLIGAKLDATYDLIRRATESAERKRLAKGGTPTPEPSPCALKWMARKLFGENPDLAIDQTLKIKNEYVQDIDNQAVVNAFQWAKARLAIQCPGALAEVQRFEADSKFFRSLVIVLALAVIWFSVKACREGGGWWIVVSISLLFGVLSFLRYVGQRFKATQQAYWLIITLETCPPSSGKKSD